MELVHGDFGGGFGPNTAVFMDDGCGGTGDDFFFDELLDFSSAYSEAEDNPPQPEDTAENEQDRGKISPVSQEKQGPPSAPPENGFLSPEDYFGSLYERKLIVQAEGLESLEWLSHFVEDSYSDYPHTGKCPTEERSKPAATATATAKELPCFTTPFRTRARTKRSARSGISVWPVLSPSFVETSTSSYLSTSSRTSFSQPTLCAVKDGDSSRGKAAPPNKRKGRPGAAQRRICSHCGVDETAQWRPGPLGSSTLCNACGIKFKLGRLLPEYRPALSPSFSTEYSNIHREVLKLRRKKQLEN